MERFKFKTPQAQHEHNRDNPTELHHVLDALEHKLFRRERSTMAMTSSVADYTFVLHEEYDVVITQCVLADILYHTAQIRMWSAGYKNYVPTEWRAFCIHETESSYQDMWDWLRDEMNIK